MPHKGQRAWNLLLGVSRGYPGDKAAMLKRWAKWFGPERAQRGNQLSSPAGLHSMDVPPTEPTNEDVGNRDVAAAALPKLRNVAGEAKILVRQIRNWFPVAGTPWLSEIHESWVIHNVLNAVIHLESALREVPHRDNYHASPSISVSNEIFRGATRTMKVSFVTRRFRGKTLFLSV